MFIGVGTPIPVIANLPGSSRPGGGSTPAFEYTAIDNSFSMEFDGVASTVNIGDFSAYDNGDLSACIWVNTSNTRTSFDWVIGNSGSTTIAGFDIGIDRYGKVRTARRTRTLTADTNYNNVGLTLNTWHHIAFTYKESTNTIKQFFDGQPTETIVGTTRNKAASVNLHIGSYNGVSNFYLGKADEVAIWSTTLSEQTIQAIYDATANNPGKVADLSETPEGQPAAWYRMGD